jgi:hypothetical protein
MLKHLFAAAAFAACIAAPADAQNGALPPVESMNCDQMMAELTVAGQRMNSQLDPEFATEAQAMNDQMQNARNGAGGSVAAGIGTSFACSIPGVGMACMAGQQAQIANAQAQAEQNQARMQAQHDRVQASMAGLDQQRLMAVSDRFEAENCQAPTQ